MSTLGAQTYFNCNIFFVGMSLSILTHIPLAALSAIFPPQAEIFTRIVASMIVYPTRQPVTLLIQEY